MGIKTDSTPVGSPKPVENSPILGLYKLVASEADYRAMEADFLRGGVGYGDLKKRLFAGIREFFSAQRARREEILADTGLVDRVLKEGAFKAREAADTVMERVRKAVGL